VNTKMVSPDFDGLKIDALQKMYAQKETLYRQLDAVDAKIDHLAALIVEMRQAQRLQVVEFFERLLTRLQAERTVIIERITRLQVKIDELEMTELIEKM